MAAKSKPNEIAFTRIYDAPVKLVWDAWTDPKKVAKWWGPRGFTLTTHSKDLRPGGHWAYTMHGPDGTDYENKTIYHEVVEYVRLVYDHGGNDDRPPLFRVTVTFAEKNGQTTMNMWMTFATEQGAQESKKFIRKANGHSTWDRLAEYLDKEIAGKERFVINRDFEAPIAKVFSMWTDPKHFAKWLPPAGLTLEFIRADIRPGGSTFFVMSDGANLKMYGRAEYLEIRSPDRIVYRQEFCDENEKMSRHPFVPTWPDTMLTTVQLAEDTPGRTRVTVTWEPHGKTTSEELKAFIDMRTSMTEGWGGSFDKLEELLK